MSDIRIPEGLNLPKSTLTEFLQDLEDRLSLLTGIVEAEGGCLSLEQIRKPILLIGLPGIGKTAGIIAMIKRMNGKLPKARRLGFKKILLGQTVVGSFSGIPVVNPATGKVTRVQMPDLPDAARDGEYGVLFLDEITTADEMQIQPALGLADDSRSLGEYTLPEHWLVVAAGNGPECANFVRLDDMTISRFAAYDISYDYKKDWRPWAHENGILEDIIAFLNFAPDTCVHIESTDMDSAGKMFPCPRSWERLSIELQIRKAVGRPVDYAEMDRFAGRIIGLRTGRQFGAFMQFRKTLTYDAERIMAGTERPPEAGMRAETYHIIIQSVLRAMSEEIKCHGNGNGGYPKEVYEKGANVFRWILQFGELEKKMNAFVEMVSDFPEFAAFMTEKTVTDMVPELDRFFTDYAELFFNHIREIREYKV